VAKTNWVKRGESYQISEIVLKLARSIRVIDFPTGHL
jgi:hypothetical protein